MEVVNYTEARANLKQLMDKTYDDSTPIIITRQRGAKPVVMMSLDSYNSMEETMYLLRSPANAKFLRAAVEDVRKGKYKKHKLLPA
ncbi:MAG: type II toxin-antitoxin system prevent-host-death family antitoxin [Alphaproteobacteria bacterium]|nr:type II toxin-antitoxin system prevent-host-death family antitoxin [Alphaproteobacteria bacterium]